MLDWHIILHFSIDSEGSTAYLKKCSIFASNEHLVSFECRASISSPMNINLLIELRLELMLTVLEDFVNVNIVLNVVD